ncbi:hypothetical protein ACHAXS_010516 [Conticribra weissflogii]
MNTIDENTPDTSSSEPMGETQTIYRDLLTFLRSPRPDLRKAAAEATLATLVSSTSTSSDDGPSSNGREAARQLTSHDVILPLCKIASALSPDDHGSIEALAALNILCSDDSVGNQCVLDFLEARGVGRMLEIALSSPPPSTDEENEKSKKEWKSWRQQVNYACALLANATRTETGAVDFIGRAFPEEAIPSSMVKRDRGLEEEEEEKGDVPNNNGKESLYKKESKPTATLLLSRFLNPAFIDTSSPVYQATLKKFGKSVGVKPDNEFDEYDSDLDIDDNHDKDAKNDKGHDELQPQKVEPTGEEYYDPYQHVAAIIMNITQLEMGRDFLMKLTHSERKQNGQQQQPTPSVPSQPNDNNSSKETSTSHLQSLLPQLASPNLHRRQGTAGTLKNCCFSQDSIWWLLHVVHIDKALLMTLAGPEELTIDEKIGLDPDYWLSGPQKVREPDPLVRLYVVEALLLLLASGRRARETLRERRMYVIIKLADMVEENEEVSERMLECVQYLRRDEEGEEEGSSDRRAYERYARGMMASMGVKGGDGMKALPPSENNEDENDCGKGKGKGDEVDYDNID